MLPDTDVAAAPERFAPATMREELLAAEHLARYEWAAALAGGWRVLDAGCGTGYGAVAYVDLDFVAGHVSADGAYAGEIWGGLGLVVVDAEARSARPSVRDDTFHPAGELLRLARDVRRGPRG
jgi:SAM-dependent methyltransferase